MSEQYVIELWIPGEERVVVGPFRSLEKASARREYLEDRAQDEDVDIETSIVALENGHSHVDPSEQLSLGAA